MTAAYIKRNLAAGRRPIDFYAHHTLRRRQLDRPHTTTYSIGTSELVIVIVILIIILLLFGYYIRRAYLAGSDYVQGKLADFEDTRVNIGRAAKMNVGAGKFLKGFFDTVTKVAKKVPLPPIPVPKKWFMKGREADRARAREGERRALFDKTEDERRAQSDRTEGERRQRFDHRYGWVDTLGEASRFDGTNSLRSDSIVDGVDRQEGDGGYYGTDLLRKRSWT
ncbi:hypothetical protein HYFRA_00013528 [Hymenoscyphus fraxineus]|uniref:Uncharacterized protein n=1 Tax=Hymenoscyphus fraxineus TaxID=746836 RepID=A0A9N9PYS2_9HELO|nr:hypothetical protein HYFRA_00013528 [Hymenoscyphus fraxineus]